ncbi:MAG: hypothetical protein ABIJ91_01935 [Candidatus Kuenenbacteria bacterium]
MNAVLILAIFLISCIRNDMPRFEMVITIIKSKPFCSPSGIAFFVVLDRKEKFRTKDSFIKTETPCLLILDNGDKHDILMSRVSCEPGSYYIRYCVKYEETPDKPALIWVEKFKKIK